MRNINQNRYSKNYSSDSSSDFDSEEDEFNRLANEALIEVDPELAFTTIPGIIETPETTDTSSSETDFEDLSDEEIEFRLNRINIKNMLKTKVNKYNINKANQITGTVCKKEYQEVNTVKNQINYKMWVKDDYIINLLNNIPYDKNDWKNISLVNKQFNKLAIEIFNKRTSYLYTVLILKTRENYFDVSYFSKIFLTFDKKNDYKVLDYSSKRSQNNKIIWRSLPIFMEKLSVTSIIQFSICNKDEDIELYDIYNLDNTDIILV